MKRQAAWTTIGIVAALMISPQLASAAPLDGATLSALWGVPFAGVLLSIAIFPLIAPAFWHHHFGKIAAAWAILFLAPFAFTFGADVALGTFVHAMLEEYVNCFPERVIKNLDDLLMLKRVFGGGLDRVGTAVVMEAIVIQSGTGQGKGHRLLRLSFL